ncbi:MAG: sulfurtransferase TusA family protein [Pseudomonadota bacterium]
MVPVLDLTGLRCPVPVIRLEAVMRKMAAHESIDVLADDPLAKIDLPHAAKSQGFGCSSIECADPQTFAYRIVAPAVGKDTMKGMPKG